MMPKETPILFNGEMVRAILEGRKTQTRRIVKLNASGRAQCKGKNWHVEDSDAVLACPLGQVGDRLWVRETHSWCGCEDSEMHADSECDLILYKASESADLKVSEGWVPSIHMPKWASRITLEITNVRVERLQDISEADAMAEGVKAVSVFSATRYAHNDDGFFGSGKDAFRDLWDSIYKNWNSNPWVWVIEFRPVNGKATQGETGAVNFQNSRK